MERSAQLQIRLARASEMNVHLRDMNVAAAGLAHETRNPLNIVRGLAQMISQQEEAPDNVRDTARDITEEVDRVTGRLGQFMDYSKPLEVKAGPTGLSHVAQEVARVLEMDLEDKSIAFALSGPALTVEADESLLRQVIFNLLLNALQAAPRGGHIEVAVGEQGQGRCFFEVKDDGPGVPEDEREAIFRPYFTSTQEGTGLGLALVRQIVLAHQWDIEYVPGETAGATFRIGGLKLV
jgi:signal transduction histidine kinase